jgi:manganese transport protein
MGGFAIKPLVQVLAWIITAVLVYLNISMVAGQAADFFSSSGNIIWKIVILLAGLIFVSLMAIAIIYPLLKRNWKDVQVQLHPEAIALHSLTVPTYSVIAVALDFSENDQKLLSHALGQGTKDTNYILLHVIESVPARLYENESDDLETQKDKEHLEFYARQLNERGFISEAKVGYGKRAKEIVRLVRDNNAQMLVIGAHGHSGLKDLIYGETINTVRHELRIPVLVVNV